MNEDTFFFCGVGGSGMSAIAQVLAGRNKRVLGSDRNYDRGLHADLFDNLGAQGIRMVPQDGSAVTQDVSELIVSSAVEASIPDVSAAQNLGIPIRKRAELLSDLFNNGHGISVGGTSGKSTVTGMIGFILHTAGQDPTIVSGGKMRDFEDPPSLGNARNGSGAVVIEADESDGTISFYSPDISILTNVSFDHKPLDELVPLFREYCLAASDIAIVNADCPISMDATFGIPRVTFSLQADADFRAEEIVTRSQGMAFLVRGQRFEISQPGRHNVSNAVAAIAACDREGVGLDAAAHALTDFKGIARRMEVLGCANGVTVFDDFAHNPDKIGAALSALKAFPGRLHVMFQPHGFGPTRMLREGLVEAFVSCLDSDDCVWMPEIYYAGGTAEKSISSADLIQDIARGGVPAEFREARGELVPSIANAVCPDDRVVIMGARDDSLTDFGHALLVEISGSEG